MRSQWNRRVIPRWRQSAVSASLTDHLPSKIFKGKAFGTPSPTEKVDLERDLDAWARAPTMGIAADLLNFAHDESLRGLLSGPAKFVLENESALSPQLRSIAVRALGSTPEAINKKPTLNAKIKGLKNQIIFNPRDSIAMVDVARLYAIKGQNERALNSIKRAVALQPDNRFVLRSASRFYIHDGKADQALSILKRSPRTQEDPWLMAALISVEAIQDKSPMFYKRAKSMIEGNRFSPFHTAELNAAIATLDANAGQFKNARKLFTHALNDPNDNALAQAIWAANEFVIPINVDPKWLTDRFSSEANYYTQENNGDFPAAFDAAIDWFEDEPFSTRPLMAASFTASIMGEFPLAEDQLRQALLLDPDDNQIRNNLVFALANQNHQEEAEKLLLDIYNSERRKDADASGHTFANLGLLFYRKGEHETGRKFYELADTILSKSRRDANSRAVAMSYWFQEASLSKDPELPSILAKANEVVGNSNSTAAKTVFSRATGTGSPHLGEKERLVRSGIVLDHDKTNNILTIARKSAF